MQQRNGRDVYVMGAANVGKSLFIGALLDLLHADQGGPNPNPNPNPNPDPSPNPDQVRSSLPERADVFDLAKCRSCIEQVVQLQLAPTATPTTSAQ